MLPVTERCRGYAQGQRDLRITCNGWDQGLSSNLRKLAGSLGLGIFGLRLVSSSFVDMEDDPESPLGLAQGNNLVFYISRNHSLATRVDEVPPPLGFVSEPRLMSRKDDRCCIGYVLWET